MGYVSSQSEAYVSLGTVTQHFPSSLVRTYGHHDYDHLRHHGLHSDSSRLTPAHHHSPLLHRASVLLFYDHAIRIFMILMTHMFSYLSLTLPSLSLDPHSFDYSSLSHAFVPLYSACPTLFVIFLFLPTMCYLRSYSSVMATLVYIV